VVELLALGGPAFSISRLESSLYKALGRPAIGLALAGVQLVVSVPAYLIGSHWGIGGVAAAVVIASYATLPLVLGVRARLLAQRMRDQIGPLAPICAATAAMAAASLLVRGIAEPRLPTWAALLSTVTAGVVVYSAAMLLLARGLLSAALADIRRSSASG
jgi:hypothetical protein